MKSVKSENQPFMIAKKVGLFCAVCHFIAFLALARYVRHATDPQAPLIWVIFAIVDFPISLLYMVGASTYSRMLAELGDSFLGQVLYAPHIIHGLFGTVWWYFLPRLLTPKKYGGIWGKSVNVNNGISLGISDPTDEP